MQFNRFLNSNIEKLFKSSKSILLLGPRQTGKSTLIEEYLKGSKKNVLSYKLQDLRTYEELIRSPEKIMNITEEKLEAGQLILYIDEVQKIPQLLDGCQYLIDKYKNKLCVILSGSSARKLRARGVNLLPGRIIVEHLHSLTIPEIKNTETQRIISLKIKEKNKVNFKITLDELLIYGTMPGILSEKEFKKNLLDSYVSTYLQEEIRAEALTRNLGAFSKFLELSALESGGSPNLSNLSQQTGIPINTVKNYFQLLEDTLITFSIPAFNKIKTRKQVLNTPKYLFFDLGVRNSAAKLNLNSQILKTELGGKLFEQFICLELIKRIQYAHPTWKYYYWRTKNGLEVDFIIQTDDEIIPIEIKYTSNIQKKHIRHLQTFMNEYKAKRGFIVGIFSQAQKIEGNIYAIPWDEI